MRSSMGKPHREGKKEAEKRVYSVIPFIQISKLGGGDVSQWASPEPLGVTSGRQCEGTVCIDLCGVTLIC